MVMRITLLLMLASSYAFASESTMEKSLLNALICKGDPANAVYNLVDQNNNFKSGYAAYGFGEGTSYKAIVILNKPLIIGSATTEAVISETENSNFDFNAFTYAKFKGDYKKIVVLLKLFPAKNSESAMGHYVSNSSGCPNAIALTPLENGEFLLGCGWHNGC